MKKYIMSSGVFAAIIVVTSVIAAPTDSPQTPTQDLSQNTTKKEVTMSGVKLPPPAEKIYKYKDASGRWVYGDTMASPDDEMTVFSIKNNPHTNEPRLIKNSITPSNKNNFRRGFIKVADADQQQKLNELNEKLKKDKALEEEIKQAEKMLSEKKELYNSMDPETNPDAYTFIGRTRVLSEDFAARRNSVELEIRNLETKITYLKSQLSY